MTAHVQVNAQQERFGVARDGDGFTEQVVTLVIRNTSDTRGWDWRALLDESDVLLVGWYGVDYKQGGPVTYKIVRNYFDSELNGEVVTTGLTLEQAQAHCRNPETSSRTATSPAAVERTQAHGPWFDGYTEE